jgi:hypothetical protein
VRKATSGFLMCDAANIKELLRREGLTSNVSRISIILGDKKLYGMLTNLITMHHFRATKTGAGFTIHQVVS